MKKNNSKVVRELRRIANENGGILQPETVVERARPVNSPLHSRFTWDNSQAAHAYRIWQARQLIRVSVEMIEGISDPVNVFISLTSDRNRDSGGYRVMTEVLSDSELKAQMLRDCLEELNIVQKKYSTLRLLARVWREVKRIKRKAA